jgi:anti-sigma B factor antagonist
MPRRKGDFWSIDLGPVRADNASGDLAHSPEKYAPVPEFGAPPPQIGMGSNGLRPRKNKGAALAGAGLSSQCKEMTFMEMAVEDAGGVTQVVLRGRLDTAGADSIDLKFNAIAGSKRNIVVDLSDVSLLTSLGIRVLLLGARAVKSKGGKLVILAPDANIRSVLQTAKTDSLVPVFDDRNAAIAAASATAG